MREGSKSSEWWEKLRIVAEQGMSVSGTEAASFASVDLSELLHEVQVYQTELEIQNEELRNSRTALQWEKDRFENLFESAPAAYMVLDERRHVSKANLAVVTLFEEARGDLLGRPFHRLVVNGDEETFLQGVRASLVNQAVQTIELRLLRKGEVPFWARVRISSDSKPGSRFLLAILDISDLKENETLKALLEEKQLLMREIHHRVKNDLQLVSSLLRLQSMQHTEPEVIVTLEQCDRQIQSISLIHEVLFQSSTLAAVNLRNYLTRLSNMLISSMYSARDRISLTLDLEPVQLPVSQAIHCGPVSQAIHCGLVITELLSNAYKHAFPHGSHGSHGSHGEISLTARLMESRDLDIHVRDNGVGLPQSVDVQNTDSFGLMLARTLVTKQLRGTFEVATEGGTHFRFSFTPEPSNEKPGRS